MHMLSICALFSRKSLFIILDKTFDCFMLIYCIKYIEELTDIFSSDFFFLLQ